MDLKLPLRCVEVTDGSDHIETRELFSRFGAPFRFGNCPDFALLMDAEGQVIALCPLPVAEHLAALETENERLREASREALLQIRYLHAKFQETGSGNAVIAQLEAALGGDAPTTPAASSSTP